MNSGLGPVFEFMMYELREYLRFCFSFLELFSCNFLPLGFTPASLMARSLVRDKGFDL